jgi:hypothetical protein
MSGELFNLTNANFNSAVVEFNLMAKVISLVEKREVWHQVYRNGELCVHLSNHGKFKFFHGGEITQLEFFDSVSFLKELSEALESVMCSMYNKVD